MLTKIIAKEEQTTQLFHLTDMKENSKEGRGYHCTDSSTPGPQPGRTYYLMLLQLDWSKQ